MRQHSISSNGLAVTLKSLPARQPARIGFVTFRSGLHKHPAESRRVRGRPHGAGRFSSEDTRERLAKTLAAYQLLGLPQDEDRAAIRAAYITRMKQLHPDVNIGKNTNAAAAAVVAAYKHLMEVCGDPDLMEIDVFEVPEADPVELFVNPFACSVDPMDWRELQGAARALQEPEAALAKAGVMFRSTAINWLTPAQLVIVERELSEMETALNFEVTAWVLDTRLAKARRVNARYP